MNLNSMVNSVTADMLFFLNQVSMTLMLILDITPQSTDLVKFPQTQLSGTSWYKTEHGTWSEELYQTSGAVQKTFTQEKPPAIR
jgi:hypothetical protein